MGDTSTHIIVWVSDQRLALHHNVDEPVDNPKCVEVDVVSIFLNVVVAVGYLLVLFQEEVKYSWAIMAAQVSTRNCRAIGLKYQAENYLPSIALSPQRDTIVMGLVIRKFEEPSLCKMPQRMSSKSRGIGCV